MDNNKIIGMGNQISTRLIKPTKCLVTQEATTADNKQRELLFVECDQLGKVMIALIDSNNIGYHIDEQALYLFLYTYSEKGVDILKVLDIDGMNLIDTKKVTNEFINSNTDSMKYVYGSYNIDFDVVDGQYHVNTITDRRGNRIELNLIEAQIGLECLGKTKKHTR